MARIRTIKPEFFGDEKLASISRNARLTFIGVLIMSDDYGVVKGHSSWLKNNIYPYDDIKLSEFESWLSEIAAVNAIIPFLHSGEQFYFIRNFSVHQKVDNPSKWRNPVVPEDILKNLIGSSASPSESRKEHIYPREGNPMPEKRIFLDAVRLTDKQHASLIEKLGEHKTGKAIECLNNYKMSRGKEYKSDYHAILNWVVERVEPGGTNGSGNTNANFWRDSNAAEVDELAARANALYREHAKKNVNP
jgi:hypothetical protein